MMKYYKREAGFTIVELMIATTVFSVILLLCTFGIIQIGKSYYKGATLVRTQNASRDIIDNVSQAIQYGTTPPSVVTTPSGQFCVGNTLYIYNVNVKVTGSAHGFQILNNCNPALATVNKELLGENMRLTRFTISNSPAGDYTIMVKVTYGDDEQINLTVPQTAPEYGNCKGGVGDQFCASSELQTTVHRRLK